MLTLNGGYGKGSLWGTFQLLDVTKSNYAACTINKHLDLMVPPGEWYLPPPDNKWYSTSDSVYGPRLQTIKVGRISSVDQNAEEWNPCAHTTLRGDVCYLGEDRVNTPYWRLAASSLKTSYQACSANEEFPILVPSYLSVMKGRPCKSTDAKVHSRNGDFVSQALTSAYNGQLYWYSDSILPSQYSTASQYSTLAQFGVPYAPGSWYSMGYNGRLSVSPTNLIHYFRSRWSRPNRTTFVREHWCEYHHGVPTIPASSIAWTKWPSVVEANHRVNTIEVVGIRSDSPGRFQIMTTQVESLEWFGYLQNTGAYEGSISAVVNGGITSLLILEPGLTTEGSLDVFKADNYCSNAVKTAELLYDHRAAGEARLAAVNDVQELDSNWIENLAGVKGTLDCVLPLVHGYKAVKEGNLSEAKKAIASAYLVYKYVVAPSLDDARDVRTNGSRILALATKNRFSNERRRGKFLVKDVPVFGTLAALSFFTTYHMRLKDKPFSVVWAAMEKLGVDPSAGQIWDLIPFSFVVDWFAPLGDALHSIDAYNSMFLHRDVLARIETFKVQWPMEEDVLKDLFDGNVCSSGKPVEYSWYDRRIYQNMGDIDPISISSGNGLTLSQMTQGAALLTQMR